MRFSNITTELLLRFETNVVVTQDKDYGDVFVQNPEHTEIHFMRVEGQYKAVDVNLNQIREEGWKKFR